MAKKKVRKTQRDEQIAVFKDHILVPIDKNQNLKIPYKPSSHTNEYLDPEMIYKTAKLQCTMAEMSDMFHVHEDTLRNRFSDIIKAGRAAGQRSLRRAMFYNATILKDSSIQKFLATNHLNLEENQANRMKDVGKSEKIQEFVQRNYNAPWQKCQTCFMYTKTRCGIDFRIL